MKKILIILFSCIAALSGRAQDAPCWYTPSWDWTDESTENWYAYVTGVGGGLSPVALGSPFVAPVANSDMDFIVQANDYQPEQGWVLLYKYFGCYGITVDGGMPHFFLYNRYTGVVRVFFKNLSSSTFSQAKITLYWYDQAKNTSLLTNCNEFALACEQYPLGSSNERILNYVQDFYSSGSWFTSEFILAFDPKTPLEDGYDLNFRIELVLNSTMALEGDFHLSTKSATVKNTNDLEGTANGNLTNWLALGKTFLGKVPKSADVNSFYNNLGNGVHSIDSVYHNGITHALHQVGEGFTTETSDLKSFLMGLSTTAVGIASGIDVALSVVSFFSGKATTTDPSVDIQPTISNGSLKLDGTIVTTTDGMASSLQLPGTFHETTFNGTTQYVDLPVYDCPLGVLSLDSVPTISTRYFLDSIGIMLDNWFPGGTYETVARRSMKSFKVDGNVVMALNGAAGVRIDTIMAAIVGIEDPLIGGADFDLLDQEQNSDWIYEFDFSELPIEYEYLDENGLFPFGTGFGRIYKYPVLNKPADYLGNGIYQWLQIDSIDGELGLHSFATQLIPLEKFKNTVFNVPSYVKPYLKIVAIMRPEDPDAIQTPILWSCTYEIPESKLVQDENCLSAEIFPVNDGEQYCVYGFPFTWDQQKKRNSDIILENETLLGVDTLGFYITCRDSLLANAIEDSILLVAECRVKLAPGFRSTAQSNLFNATIERHSNFGTGENAKVIHTYFEDCVPYPYKSLFYANQSGQMVSPFSATYSSLTNQIRLNNAQPDELYFVSIYDALGSLIQSGTMVINSMNNMIQLNGQIATGVYLIRLESKKNTLTSLLYAEN